MAKSRPPKKPRPPKKDRVVREILDAGEYGSDESGFFGVEFESGKRLSLADIAERVSEPPATTSLAGRPYSPQTGQIAVAVALYCGQNFHQLPKAEATLARAVCRYAEQQKLPGWDDAAVRDKGGIDARNSTLRGICGELLKAMRTRRR